MNRGRWLSAVSFGLVAVFINSCKQDTGGVGANVLPPGDIISAYVSDSSTILTSMYLKDTVPTNAIYPMLGSYRDPIFGVVKASIFALLFSPTGSTTIPWNGSYSTNNVYPGYVAGTDTGVVDSAVLLIPILTTTSYYGTPGPATFVVYQSANSMPYDTATYSNYTPKYNPTPIGIQQVTPNPGTSDTIRIKLSSTWLTSIRDSMNKNPSYYYPSFASLVRALYITVSNTLQLPGQGCIYYTDCSSSFSGIYIYYHSAERIYTAPQSEYYAILPLGTGGNTAYSSYNHIELDHSTAPFASEHPSGTRDSIAANNLVYLQNGGGPLGRINFPNFYKNWSKLGPIVINKAEVDITVDAQDCPNPYLPPASLYLEGTDKYGTPYNLPDYTNDGLTNDYGGVYDAFNNTYTFSITQYIQKVIQHVDTDRGLYIIPIYNYSSANRVVLYGAQHGMAAPSANRMKLRIFYTPLPATHKAEKH